MTLLERCDEVSHPALSVCAQLVDENVHTERARTTIHALLLYLSLKPDHAMLRCKYGTVRVSKRFPTGPACPLVTILSYALSTISCEPSVSKFDICNAPNPLTEGSRLTVDCQKQDVSVRRNLSSSSERGVSKLNICSICKIPAGAGALNRRLAT
jgi:hypothetical protein